MEKKVLWSGLNILLSLVFDLYATKYYENTLGMWFLWKQAVEGNN